MKTIYKLNDNRWEEVRDGSSFSDACRIAEELTHSSGQLHCVNNRVAVVQFTHKGDAEELPVETAKVKAKTL
jgi:hypothetical protein